MIFIISKKQENIQKKTNLIAFNQKDITAIEIAQYTDTLRIEMDSNEWRITKPIQKKAKPEQIEKFFNEFLSLQISDNYVSDQIDKQSFYNVDEENGTKISLFGKNNKFLKKVYYGRGENSNNCYARLDREKNIYQVNNVQTAVNTGLYLWRYDVIFEYPIEQIKRIAIQQAENKKIIDSYMLFNENGNWNIIVNDITSEIENSNNSLMSLLSSIESLRAADYYDEIFYQFKDKFAEPEVSVNIMLNTDETVLLTFAKNDTNSYILMIDSDEETIYRIREQSIKDLKVKSEMFMDK
jgi:hypothetical protein